MIKLYLKSTVPLYDFGTPRPYNFDHQQTHDVSNYDHLIFNNDGSSPRSTAQSSEWDYYNSLIKNTTHPRTVNAASLSLYDTLEPHSIFKRRHVHSELTNYYNSLKAFRSNSPPSDKSDSSSSNSSYLRPISEDSQPYGVWDSSQGEVPLIPGVNDHATPQNHYESIRKGKNFKRRNEPKIENGHEPSDETKKSGWKEFYHGLEEHHPIRRELEVFQKNQADLRIKFLRRGPPPESYANFLKVQAQQLDAVIAKAYLKYLESKRAPLRLTSQAFVDFKAVQSSQPNEYRINRILHLQNSVPPTEWQKTEIPITIESTYKLPRISSLRDSLTKRINAFLKKFKSPNKEVNPSEISSDPLPGILTVRSFRRSMSERIKNLHKHLWGITNSTKF